LLEQLPFVLDPLRTITGTLAEGDYSVVGLESLIAIERKSLPDLVSCCAVERERFERELQRLLAYPTRCVVVEARWSDLEAGDWRSKVTPQSVTGSVLAWIGMGVPFLFAGDRGAAQRATGRLLFVAARRRYRELRALVNAETERASA
jgi:DNA excision repair protein ERCC-4